MTCKTLIPLFIFFFSSLHLHTQAYIPTIIPGNKISRGYSLGMGSFYPSDARITCDTFIFNGKKYYWAIEGTQYDGSPSSGYHHNQIYLREDTTNKKVYYLDVENPVQEVLYLDYDLEVGDTMPYYPEGYNSPITLVIDSIYEKEYLGLNRKFFKYEAIELVLIEGIGRNFFGFLPPSNGFEHYYHIYDFEMLDCQAILDTILKVEPIPLEPEDIVIYPNPYTDHFQLKFKKWGRHQSALLQIFTMEGWLVHEQEITKSPTSIYTKNYPAGVLIVKVYYNDLVATFKTVHLAKPR